MASMSDYRREIAERDLRAVWPQWKIVRLLGMGAFGEVYEIQRNEYGRITRCALKVLRKENNGSEQGSSYANIRRNNSSEEFISTVLKEIDIMEKLKGAPNIVVIEDYDVVRNADSCSVLIRMELLRNIDDFIISRQQITVNDVIRIGVDICSALEYCESQNIIHRDVKESNIFYSDMGMFKLGDFGISRQLAGYVMNNITMTSAGTISRMAPEVYRGDKYDNRVDIYSLGMVLYCLLNCGRSPFYPSYPNNVSVEDAYNADMTRIKGSPVPPLQGVDPRLSDIICKACNPRPSGRYRTASEFKNALLSYYRESVNDGIGWGQYGDRDNRIRILAGVSAIAAIVLAAGVSIAWIGGRNHVDSTSKRIAYVESDKDNTQNSGNAEPAQESSKTDEIEDKEDKEDKKYLEPEVSEEEEEEEYYYGASGQSIRQMADYVKPTKSTSHTEEVDSSTLTFKNSGGSEIAFIEQPVWASEVEVNESADIYYYNGDYTKFCDIFFLEGATSANTFVSMVIDEYSADANEKNGSEYEISEQRSVTFNGNSVSWVVIKELSDGVYAVSYWGGISCDEGCIAVCTTMIDDSKYPDFTDDEYLEDIDCVTLVE